MHCRCADSLSRLSHLQTLHIENNQIEALPDSISACAALVKLTASTNLLQSLPPSMAGMRKVQRLDFANNMIRRVPPVMGHMRTLKEFNLRYNNLDPVYQAAADEGLSRFLAFLKEEEDRESAEARERMRPVGTQVFLPTYAATLLRSCAVVLFPHGLSREANATRHSTSLD